MDIEKATQQLEDSGLVGWKDVSQGQIDENGNRYLVITQYNEHLKELRFIKEFVYNLEEQIKRNNKMGISYRNDSI